MKKNYHRNNKADTALGTALFASTVWVIFSYLFYGISHYILKQDLVRYTYIFLCFIYPVVLIFIAQSKTLSFFVNPFLPMSRARVTGLFVNLTYLTITLIIADNIATPYLMMGIFSFYFLAIAFKESSGDQNNKEIINLQTPLSYFIAILCLLIYSSTFINKAFTDQYEMILYIYSNIKPAFYFLTITSSIIIFTLFSKKINDVYKPYKWLIFLTYLSSALLLDAENSFEIENYNAYIGPAISALHGKIPLVDIFCQYGLNYLVFTLAFLLLPNNYGIAALIISMFNVFYLITLLSILRSIIKNPVHFSLIGLCFIFGIYFSIEEGSPNTSPSSMSFRYLPPALFLVYLLNIFEKKIKIPILKSAALLSLNFLWSFESAVFSFLIYGFSFFLTSKNIFSAIQSIAKTTLYLLLIMATFVFIYWISFKLIPNYLFYLKYLHEYLSPSNSITMSILYTYGPQSANGVFYILPVIATVFTLFYFSILYKNIGEENQSSILKRLYLINFSCIILLSYRAFRAQTDGAISILFISFIPLLYHLRSNLKNDVLRKLANIILALTCICLTIIFTCNSLKFKASIQTIGNVVISHLIQTGKPTSENFENNLLNFCSNRSHDDFLIQNPRSDSTLNTCNKMYYGEASYLIGKWAHKPEGVMLFNKNSVQILFRNKTYHTCLPNPMNDELFFEMANFGLNKCLSAVKSGSVLIIDKSLDLYELELDILKNINKKFVLDKVDETNNFIVLKLSTKQNVTPVNFSMPIYFFKKTTLSDGIVYENFKEIKETSNDDVVTLSIDLNNLETINKISLWRRIGSPNPSIIPDDNLFIRDATLSVSTDNLHWKMVYHDNNLNNVNRRYYEMNISPIKCRYIRINFLNIQHSIMINRVYIFPTDNMEAS